MGQKRRKSFKPPIPSAQPTSPVQEPRMSTRSTRPAVPAVQQPASTNTFTAYSEDLQYSVENDLLVQEDHSLTFWLFRYPFLILCTVALIIDLILYWTLRGIVSTWEHFHHRLTAVRKLKETLRNSKNYEEYKSTAQELDKRLGHNEWKGKPTRLFDERLLKRVTEEMKQNRTLFRTRALMDTLLTSAIKSDLGGIENEELYSRCYYGTKYTIDEYVNEVVDSINYVGESIDVGPQEKFTFFRHASKLYGRTALCLSGGAGLAWFHMGVCKSLFEQKLLPTVFTGASAGSMVAAMICVRTNDELDELFQPSLWQRIRCCSATPKERLRNFWKTGAIFEIETFTEEAKYFTKGDMTFKEAYEKTGRILNICVMSTEKHSRLKVLNFINSPHVTIRSASVASSSIPGVIPPCVLYMKDSKGNIVPYTAAGTSWRDGSMISDIPEREIHQQFRVKHTIVSQVNPHISMFFFRPKGTAGSPSLNRGGKGWYYMLT